MAKFYCFASKGEAQGTPVPEAVILPLRAAGMFEEVTQRPHSAASPPGVIMPLLTWAAVIPESPDRQSLSCSRVTSCRGGW